MVGEVRARWRAVADAVGVDAPVGPWAWGRWLALMVSVPRARREAVRRGW